MAAKKKQQTHAKRARELAVKERRELKRVKKAEARAQREEGYTPPVDSDGSAPGDEVPAEPVIEWVR